MVSHPFPSSIQPTSTPVYASNREALKQLERERDWLSGICGVLGSGVAVSAVYSPAISLAGLPPMAILLKRLQKVSQIYLSMGPLLEAFEQQGVEIFPRLQVPEQESLDLFVRFPNKQFFAITLRTMSKSSIVYNEKAEALYVRYRQGGLKPWKPDPLLQLADQEVWLRKNRRELFGGSSRDVRRPVVKILALAGETRLGKHSEHLYETISEQKFVCVRRKFTTTVLEKEQLVRFIRAWQAQKA